jgi:hypothetical protein
MNLTDLKLEDIVLPLIAGVAGCVLIFESIYLICKYSAFKRKSDNETYVERSKAKLEAGMVRIKAAKELLADENFKKYLQRRQEVAEKLMKNTGLVEDGWDLETSIDAVVGRINDKIEGYIKLVEGGYDLETSIDAVVGRINDKIEGYIEPQDL